MTRIILLVALVLAGCGEPESVRNARLNAEPQAGWTGCDMDWRRCEPGQKRWND